MILTVETDFVSVSVLTHLHPGLILWSHDSSAVIPLSLAGRKYQIKNSLTRRIDILDSYTSMI